MMNKNKPADKNKWTKDSVIKVYHGKELGAGNKPMNPNGFYVTADKSMAEKYFGDVHTVNVPAKDLLPDSENEAEQDRKLSGLESLKIGSAVVPHEYYGKLQKENKMKKQMEPTDVRLVVLVQQSQKDALLVESEKTGVLVSEIIRRMIDAQLLEK